MSADVAVDVTCREFVREGADVGALNRDKKVEEKRSALQAELHLTVRNWGQSFSYR